MAPGSWRTTSRAPNPRRSVCTAPGSATRRAVRQAEPDASRLGPDASPPREAHRVPTTARHELPLGLLPGAGENQAFRDVHDVVSLRTIDPGVVAGLRHQFVLEDLGVVFAVVNVYGEMHGRSLEASMPCRVVTVVFGLAGDRECRVARLVIDVVLRAHALAVVVAPDACQ